VSSEPSLVPKHPWRILFIFLAGVLLTALPYFFAAKVSDDFGAWQALASSTLNNVGVAIALLAFAFLLEPVFTRTVTTAVSGATTKRTEQIVEDATAPLTARIADLEGRMAENRQQATERGVASAEAVLEHVSFDSVAGALEEANEIGALKHGTVTVPAGAADGPRFTFTWAPDHGASTSPRPYFATRELLDDGPTGHPALTIEYVAAESNGPGDWQGPARVVWAPDEDAGAVIGRLGKEMVTGGHSDAVKRFDDPALFTHFSAAVRAAIYARNSSDEAWFTGRLIEWVDEGCAVTEDGLYFRGFETVLASEFPEVPFPAGASAPKPSLKWPEKPDGVPDELWEVALGRAAPHLRRNPHRSHVFEGSGVSDAYTTSTSPRTPKGGE